MVAAGAATAGVDAGSPVGEMVAGGKVALTVGAMAGERMALEAKVGVVGERAGGDAGSPVGEMVAVGRVEMVDPLVACAEEMG